jgi:hypothetical protein
MAAVAADAKISPTNTYSRRRPELTPCYKIIQEELSTFVGEREAEGRPLPRYVMEEFEAYLRCGIPAYGFLRLQCNGCHEEKIVAFSCKKRGLCPSCCGKRMAESAAHLVDNVLPMVPFRQFVLSFPIPLRFWLHANEKLYAKIHQLVMQEIHHYYRRKATALGLKDPKTGAIAFTQRWGSALNLNIHLHIICADGVWITLNEKPHFRNLEPITDDQVADLVDAISDQVIRHLQKKGHLNENSEVVENPLGDDIFRENAAVSEATVSSIAGKIAFGPNAGKYVTRIGSGFGYFEEIPLAKGRRCFSVNGFSLHANTSTNTQARDRLEKLIKYIARGPFSNERIAITPEKMVRLKLKTAYSDGTSHLLLTFGEFIEKLVALIPRPRIHLVRWSGVFAPNSPLRSDVILKPEIKKGFQFKNTSEDLPVEGSKNSTWASLLKRTFKFDMTKCSACGGEVRFVGSVRDPGSVIRYLRHVGIDHEAPSQAPPKRTAASFEFDDVETQSDF